MKKIILSICFILNISLFLIGETGIKFEKNIINLGIIDEGQAVQVNFVFENIGDEVLVIKKINTSCGCIRKRLGKREYDPGEKGKIEIIFNSQEKLGRINEPIIIFTNTEKKYHQLLLIGNVIRKNFAYASLSARKVDFGKVELGKVSIKEIVIENIGKRGMRILEITNSPQIIIECMEIRLLPNEKCPIILTFKPKETGDFNTFIKIRTSALKGKHLTIHAVGQVTDKIEVNANIVDD